MMHLTKISALDLAPSNVRVNSVSPVRRNWGERERGSKFHEEGFDHLPGFVMPPAMIYKVPSAFLKQVTLQRFKLC